MKTTTLQLAAILVLNLSRASLAQNLVVNPDFTAGLNGWTIGNGSGPGVSGSTTWDSDSGSATSGSGRLTLTEGGSGSGGAAQTLPSASQPSRRSRGTSARGDSSPWTATAPATRPSPPRYLPPSPTSGVQARPRHWRSSTRRAPSSRARWTERRRTGASSPEPWRATRSPEASPPPPFGSC